MGSIRPIAFYLPQFHPIPENDKWWGKGFTEWSNVAKAKPLFKGHKQPHLPADLGFYDLRVPEVREEQARLARNAGIEGFCYWHYWFGNGKRLLERPFNEVLESGRPDYPFCLAWANESWSGIWHGASDRVLMKQEYPGNKDYEEHFYSLLPAFTDSRYIKVEGKPLFLIYNPEALPDMKEFCDLFNELAIRNGLDGIYLVANNISNVKLNWDPELFGFNAYTTSAHNRIMHDRISEEGDGFFIKTRGRLERRLKKLISDGTNNPPVLTFKYEEAIEYFLIENKLSIDSFPTVITGWDNSPRCGERGLILTDYNPEVFRKHLKQVFSYTENAKNKIVFIKSWNEWAEGNYLEPETEYGHAFLEVLKEEIEEFRRAVK